MPPTTPVFTVGRPSIFNLDVVGTPNGSGVTVQECGEGALRQTVITLTNVSIAITDTGGANGGYGSLKLYDAPQGVLDIAGAVSELTFTAGANIVATGAVLHSVGTAAEATDATLNATQANILPSTSTTLAASTGTGRGVQTTRPGLLDGSSTALDFFLNLGIADANISASSTVTVSGQIVITWANLGAPLID